MRITNGLFYFICTGFLLLLSDLLPEDSGNYTCEIRGRRSTVLAVVVHLISVRGLYCRLLVNQWLIIIIPIIQKKSAQDMAITYYDQTFR